MSKKVAKTTNNRTATAASALALRETIVIEQEMDFSDTRGITFKRITDDEEWRVFRINIHSGAASAEITITQAEMQTLISAFQRLAYRR